MSGLPDRPAFLPTSVLPTPSRPRLTQVSREIEIHASMLHPNIVRLYAAFEDADGIYLVQEYAPRGGRAAAAERGTVTFAC